MREVILKPGREKAIQKHHPWIFASALMPVDETPELGETVIVRDSQGNLLALGAYSPHSNIRIRLWTWDIRQEIDPPFFRERLGSAIQLRQRMGFGLAEGGLKTSAYRLVYAESDRMPGLIVDRYQDTLVIQCLSAGPESWREQIVDILADLTGLEQIFERSDVDVRELEGLPPVIRALRGREPASRMVVQEAGISYWVDLHHGQKTGFYLDQRDNRTRVKHWAQDREILDCFTYTGGFTLNAILGGARSVTAIDASTDALGLARENLQLNGLPADSVEWIEGDVFHELRKLRDRRKTFDMIILDPPKFAPTSAQVERASRGYKDINLLAFKLLRPGGILVTFSCSGGVSEDLFQKIVYSAALDAGVEVHILERLHQGMDHPVLLNFPEGMYLKGFVLSVI
jgi:23S rRNA (cytosine1962-C5)-methyltransferase